MICPHCGKYIDRVVGFCIECGHPGTCECSWPWISDNDQSKYREYHEYDDIDEIWELEAVDIHRSDRQSELSDLKHLKIQSLYYITSIKNLPSILDQGILSHCKAHEQGLVNQDISMPEVQRLRCNRAVGAWPLHDYACLYFNPLNPMLYKLKDKVHDLVILGISPEVIFEPSTIFTDGNAASYKTKFFSGTEFLSKLNWDVIKSRYWNDYPDGKRIRCAEVLVLFEVLPEMIRQVLCYSHLEMNKCIDVIGRRHIPIKLARQNFFQF